MDESTQSEQSNRRSTGRSAAQDRTAITSPPAVRTHSSTAEQVAAAAGPGDRSGVEPATHAAFESGNGKDSGLVGRVRERAGAQLATQKDAATDGIGTIARAVRKTTQELREQRHETIADYVDRAADQLERLSAGLKNKDVGDLFRDAQHLARRRPAVFIGSAFAVGIIGARFLKSSAPDRGGRHSTWQPGRNEGDTSPAHMGYRYSQASAYGEAAPGSQSGAREDIRPDAGDLSSSGDASRTSRRVRNPSEENR